MKEIKITEEEVGELFLNALIDVLNVRKQKRHQYKDAFIDDTYEFLRLTIENKLKRLASQLENGYLKDEIENIETARDSAIDICNYCLFLIAKINEGHKK